MDTRLIEVAFPLKQASLDSLHEKTVRHGHISSLHIWPARRPLAACRAALIATLLPDPGTPQTRKELIERIGGRVRETVKKKKLPTGRTEEKLVQETEGGILHWGRETAPDMDRFRAQIREAYGGRAPRVLDPFAGGGAIPLEAMRLGCEVAAVDINPVAWFVLKSTLEYPQRLAGETRPLPEFAIESREFMEAYYKGTTRLSRRQIESLLQSEQLRLFDAPEANLAWHVRAWGWWVLEKAKADLREHYPIVNSKPTIAYLWARTCTCKNCRATVPLLKTRWLAKTDSKRTLLNMEPNADRSGVTFFIESDVPKVGGNTAQRREHDKRIGAGTMSRSGASCPLCGVIMTMEDLRAEGRAGRLGYQMTSVVVEGENGKEFRLPTSDEITIAAEATERLGDVFADVPFGLPDEPTPEGGGSGASRAFSLRGYGLNRWMQLFTPRQLLALGVLVKHTRAARGSMADAGYPEDWAEALIAYLACGIDRFVDFANVNAQWKVDVPTINHALVRFAVQFTWDFAEGNPIGNGAGSYWLCQNRIATALDELVTLPKGLPRPTITKASAVSPLPKADLIITDPPYYDAIPYSDLMDWFYIWLRRTVFDLSPDYRKAMSEALGPKWDNQSQDGELIDDSSRHQGDAETSKRTYENGMAKAFSRCFEALESEGRLVVVFANKQPDAWETLVSSLIRAGFVVEASWPIQTEQASRTRGQASAALSASIWLVAKKRPITAKPGWDNRVLDDMRERITTRLRDFWDAGVRGPDFVWAATGPALEAYSKHPAVKKANDLGQTMTVTEFLKHVRRLVVEFVVGRVLDQTGEDAASGLDDVTTYYLLHRHDFGMADVPAGACILYAISCGLSDAALADQYDILIRSGGQTPEESDDEDEDGGEKDEVAEGSGSTVKLRPWHQRKRKSMGYDPEGKPAPLIDQIHRLMHLWKAGDVVKVDDYLDERGLRRNRLFHHLLQALIELAGHSSEERSLLESISNHVVNRGLPTGQERFQF